MEEEIRQVRQDRKKEGGDKLFRKPMKMRDLEVWGVPDFILDIWEENYSPYLLPVQEEAVRNYGVLDYLDYKESEKVAAHVPYGETHQQGQNNNNLVVISPTSSGKTFIGEMAAITQALHQKKTIYLVPLRSLAEEKYQHFRDLYARGNLKTLISSRDRREDDPKIRRGDYQIAVMIYEKFYYFLLAYPQFLSNVSLVIIDELQMINDPVRGPLLEEIITLLRKKRPELKIIGLSAFLDHETAFLNWISARCLYTYQRPLELRKGIVREGVYHYITHNHQRDGSEVFFAPGEVEENSYQDYLKQTVSYLLKKGEPTLLFLPTRRETRRWAAWLYNQIEAPRAEKAISELSRFTETQSRNELLYLLEKGIAYHNADLSWEERNLIETYLKEGEIKLVCATTTLAMGVNLPFKNVILSPEKYSSKDEDYRHSYLTSLTRSEVENMGGRAGRLNLQQNREGEEGEEGTRGREGRKGKEEEERREEEEESFGRVIFLAESSFTESVLQNLYFNFTSLKSTNLRLGGGVSGGSNSDQFQINDPPAAVAAAAGRGGYSSNPGLNLTPEASASYLYHPSKKEKSFTNFLLKKIVSGIDSEEKLVKYFNSTGRGSKERRKIGKGEGAEAGVETGAGVEVGAEVEAGARAKGGAGREATAFKKEDHYWVFNFEKEEETGYLDLESNLKLGLETLLEHNLIKYRQKYGKYGQYGKKPERDTFTALLIPTRAGILINSRRIEIETYLFFKEYLENQRGRLTDLELVTLLAKSSEGRNIPLPFPQFYPSAGRSPYLKSKASRKYYWQKKMAEVVRAQGEEEEDKEIYQDILELNEELKELKELKSDEEEGYSDPETEDYLTPQKVLLLMDWIGDQEIKEMEETYQVYAGAIGKLAEGFSWLADSLAAIAEESLGWGRKGEQKEKLAKIRKLAERLAWGVEEEGLRLARLHLPGLSRSYIKALLREGYSERKDLQEAAEEELARIIPPRLARRIKERFPLPLKDKGKGKEKEKDKEKEEEKDKDKDKKVKERGARKDSEEKEEEKEEGEEENNNDDDKEEKEKKEREKTSWDLKIKDGEDQTTLVAESSAVSVLESVPPSTVPLTPVLQIDLRRPDRIIFLGEAVKVTATQFSLIYFLAQHREEVISYEELLDKFWKEDEEAIYNRVSFHLSQIRRKIDQTLGEDRISKEELKSIFQVVPGRGVMLKLQAEEIKIKL